ncbi:MAG: hypothetical protein K0U20_08400 [Proteobacteria bacterium]|nr:hypothetical protein [Pseudomonadota bacterium]
MLTIPSGTSEKEALQRIKQARGNAEPEAEPTEEPQIVDVSIDTTDEETEEAEDYQEDNEEPEEGSSVEEVAQNEESDEEEYYLDLDGEEVSFSQIKEWKSGSMMQSDYTRKTTELADERKALEQEKGDISAKQAKLNDLVTQLEVMVSEGELTPDEVKELREFEPDEYIKYTERQQAKKDALSKAKASSKPSFDPQVEQQKLFNSNPDWLDNGKPTDAYQRDSKLINDYAANNGITADKFATFDAGMIQMMLDAARFKSGNVKAAVLSKKVRKAPVSTKPRQAASQGIRAQVEEAKKRFKANPTEQNAVALRKLNRQLNK